MPELGQVDAVNRADVVAHVQLVAPEKADGNTASQKVRGQWAEEQGHRGGSIMVRDTQKTVGGFKRNETCSGKEEIWWVFGRIRSDLINSPSIILIGILIEAAERRSGAV